MRQRTDRAGTGADHDSKAARLHAHLGVVQGYTRLANTAACIASFPILLPRRRVDLRESRVVGMRPSGGLHGPTGSSECSFHIFRKGISGGYICIKAARLHAHPGKVEISTLDLLANAAACLSSLCSQLHSGRQYPPGPLTLRTMTIGLISGRAARRALAPIVSQRASKRSAALPAFGVHNAPTFSGVRACNIPVWRVAFDAVRKRLCSFLVDHSRTQVIESARLCLQRSRGRIAAIYAEQKITFPAYAPALGPLRDRGRS